MSSDFSAAQLARLAGGGLQRSIAADVWPNGGVLLCRICGSSKRITSDECGQYLASGWPKHCGVTMSCKAAARASGSSDRE